MQLYKVIHTGDPYTFMARNNEVAALTVSLFGLLTGAREEYGKGSVPVFDTEQERNAWFEQEFGKTMKSSMNENTDSVLDSLESFRFGTIKDRTRNHAALSMLQTQEQKDLFVEVWNRGKSDTAADLESVGRLIAKELRKTRHE